MPQRSGGRRWALGKKLPKPDNCLNCGTSVVTHAFCPDCGQKREDHTVALSVLVGDLLSEVASFDSKFIRTVVPLVTRPGKLTQEFCAGRRVRYLSPLKMYITLSVAFFLVLGWRSSHLAPLNLEPPKSVTPAVQQQIDKAKAAALQPGWKVRPARLTNGGITLNPYALTKTASEYDAEQAKLPPAKRATKWESMMTHQAIKLRDDPGAFMQGVLTNTSRMMFVLLPIFALMLKAIYLTRRRHYVEHLVFALHVHAFWFLVLTAVALITAGWAYGAAAIILPIYTALAMKTMYAQSWFATFFKLGVLSFMYMMTFTIASVAVVMLTFLVG